MSFRQSMYTGLAQPEVKMNGLSSENSTAFTSSSNPAVVSAMKDLSAECMGARILAVTIAATFELRSGGGDGEKGCNSGGDAALRIARRSGADLPLRRQGREEVLRLDSSAAVRRH